MSTLDQSTVRQLDGVPLDRVFEDKASGKDVNRPQLEAMIGFVRDGDTVLVHSMDRLARNLEDLRWLVRRLTDKQVRVEFVKEQLTFTGEDSAMANLLLNMMGAFAEFERELIRERQREGIALAKQRGAYRGRARSLGAAQVAELVDRAGTGVPNMQRKCDGSTIPWGFNVSGAWCSGAISSASETGLQWWDHTSRTTGKNAPHKEWCDYGFHGTMTGIKAGHQISYYDNITFRKRSGFSTGTVFLDTSGIFTVTNQK